MIAVPDPAAAVLARWRDQCRAVPGGLPRDCVPVQARLVRAVGRGHLPGLGDAYVKVMAFPRARDRLRYSVRPLPAVHEARVLGALAVRAPDVPCPRVLDVVADRAFGFPVLSVLVTAGLPVDRRARPDLAALAAVTARLATVGVFHPDLNTSNFVPLDDGRIGVLDLQSARLRSGALGRRLRLRMAAKLLLDAGGPDADPEPIAAAGLVAGADVGALRGAVRRLAIDQLRRRIARCHQESTEFRVRWRWNGREVRRRDAPSELHSIRGGAEIPEMWVGDRVAEVLDGRTPRLAGVFRKWRWLPGQNAAYIRGQDDRSISREQAADLLASAARWRRIRRTKRLDAGGGSTSE